MGNWSIMGLYHSEGPTMDLDKSYRLRLPTRLFEEAIAKAKREDLTLAQVMRKLLREWVAEESSLDTREGSQPENRG